MRRLLNVSGLWIAMLLTVCVGQARASTILLNLEDPAGQSNTPFNLSFIATSTSTDVTFAGYQVPSEENANDIRLTTGGGPNLLGLTWTFTPAPSGSDTFQGGAGAFGTNNLAFLGVTEDSFDQYTQTVSTVIGHTYSLQFLFSNSPSNAASELVVSTSAGAAAVPEPASLTLLAGGLVVLAARYRRRRHARV